MAEQRIGRQTPTQSVVIPYKDTKGPEAVQLYNNKNRACHDWQQLQIYDIMAVDENGLWLHMKYGLAVPRRNGKNEVIIMRELWGLVNGEKIMHTAHRTTTSHSAWERLITALSRAGYREGTDFKSTAQKGLETITMLTDGGGSIQFRTRSSKGGLGEGYDLLIIDEAQEYTTDQESALQYVVTDSSNPQTIMTGTPPTAVSVGTVFTEFRNDVFAKEKKGGWAEWSVDKLYPVIDLEMAELKELWYEVNPSLGLTLTERSVADESRKDEIDYCIQRLGLWLLHNQKSAISQTEWEELQLTQPPKLQKRLFAAVKYGKDGTNVALSVSVKTKDDLRFVECLDCRSVRDGNGWIVDYLKRMKPEKIVIDGQAGQNNLAKDLKENHVKNVLLPTVKEVISAASAFEQAIFSQQLCHMGQPSLTQAAGNCEHRMIGSSGGFGYKALKEGIEIAILESVMLAFWACNESKEKKVQRINY